MNLREVHITMRVRIATKGDIPSITSVLCRSFAEYESLYTPEAFAATTPTADQLEKRWNEGPVWVVLRDGHLVGTVGVVPRGTDLYVRSMAVLPDARGQKIGNLLLDEVERYAEAGGFKRLFLSTTPFLGAAIRLYEHHGFRKTPDEPHELFGTPLFTMVKVTNR